MDKALEKPDAKFSNQCLKVNNQKWLPIFIERYTYTPTHVYACVYMCVCTCVLLSCVRLFATPWTIYIPWNSPGQNSGVGSRSRLQGILPTQGLNPGLPHCRRILYMSSHQEGRCWLQRHRHYRKEVKINRKIKCGLLDCAPSTLETQVLNEIQIMQPERSLEIQDGINQSTPGDVASNFLKVTLNHI